MLKNIVLSICIPTYNRASLLKESLYSIVNQSTYNPSKVEIIISDNCSTDNTEEVVSEFIQNYDGIVYHKRATNNGFLNILSVLQYAKGDFIKILNDYTIFGNNSLQELLLCVENNIQDKPQIFFGNGRFHTPNISNFYTYENFLTTITFWSTYLGGFSIWREDYLKCKHLPVEEMFPHTSLLFMQNQKSRYVLNNQILFINQKLESKGGYNLFEVFVVNYLAMYDEYVSTGMLTKKFIKEEKSRLFNGFIIDWMIKCFIGNGNTVYTFKTEGAIKILLKYFWYMPSLYLVLFRIGSIRLILLVIPRKIYYLACKYLKLPGKLVCKIMNGISK